MGIDAYFVFPIKLRRMREGPLGPHVDLFADRLLEEGHSRQSAWRNLAVVCDFSHWLARRDLDLHDIDERTVDAYQRFRARYRCPLGGHRPALLRLLSVLREAHVILPLILRLWDLWNSKRRLSSSTYVENVGSPECPPSVTGESSACS